ncbi:hypothetical protein PPL_03130 [Heterostelium album PN500]|uniref:Transmembrane protein n=1 Tax=Heterostelium pallidum (strain ATCC 26659 / Pp 5 / PN500) TaxID=670386 RepID=D3B409_HETP5|nr:hypothetical protein PPL_03130 [Heterostelium album PN500]EFA84057.1 hypothetical protein PPL_03130 [Heterostelium album PN500]|eukprot:XP_020436174.1 hypothetical protein PPL_03130 [Heterostelium album PN500]
MLNRSICRTNQLVANVVLNSARAGRSTATSGNILIRRSLSSTTLNNNRLNYNNILNNNGIRSYCKSTTETPNNNNNTEQKTTDNTSAKPDRNKIIQKYIVKDMPASHKDFTDKGYEVVFYSKREAIFKNLKLLFGGQIALTSVVPIGFLLKGSEIKYTMFGMMLVAWSTSFYFIGKMMMSNFVIRLYYKKGENFIYIVQYAPNARVLKVPIEDIKPSSFNPDGTPFLLLESDQLFFFERDGMLKNREALEYILSGDEYDLKTKSREEAEYNEHIANSLETAQKIDASNKTLDEQLKSLEQELNTLKNDNDTQQQQQQSSSSSSSTSKQ